MTVLRERSLKIAQDFSAFPTTIVSDNLGRVPGIRGVRPFHRQAAPMSGVALTVRTAAGDNKLIYQALDRIQPGDVLVIDGEGDVERALIGEIMSSIAKMRGAHGMVLDGAVRDSAALARSDFPVFARAAVHRGPYKNGPGVVGAPVAVGGMVVSTGDIVLGDADGVVAFSPDAATELLAACQKQAAKEAEILSAIREGRYASEYV